MRQLAGTIALFALMSCAAATEVLDEEAPASVITLSEVTVVGSPEAIDLDVPLAKLCEEGNTCTEDPKALESAKISLAAPFLAR